PRAGDLARSGPHSPRSSREGPFLERRVNGAGRVESARVQDAGASLPGREAPGSGRFPKRSDGVGGPSVTQPRESDVRPKFALLALDAEADAGTFRRLCDARDRAQGLARSEVHSENTGLPMSGERDRPLRLYLPGDRFRAGLGDLALELFESRPPDIAQELQGQMPALRLGPGGGRKSRAEPLDEPLRALSPHTVARQREKHAAFFVSQDALRRAFAAEAPTRKEMPRAAPSHDPPRRNGVSRFPSHRAPTGRTRPFRPASRGSRRPGPRSP